MATSPNMTPLPPSVLTVYLRLRFSSRPMQWTFYRETAVQYQLDNALQSYTSFTAHHFHDAVGIMVNDQLFVDDSPFWRNLLVSGATYDVAYLRRPFWNAPWTRLRDAVVQTPLVDTVPGRAQRFTSRPAYAALRAEGLLTGEEWICRHGRMYAKYCHTRSESEIEQAWREGRGIDWERMLLLKAFGKVDESRLVE